MVSSPIFVYNKNNINGCLFRQNIRDSCSQRPLVSYAHGYNSVKRPSFKVVGATYLKNFDKQKKK